MGIGLVDPILPAISGQLDATPSKTTLLFTSYLVVTAVPMLVANGGATPSAAHLVDGLRLRPAPQRRPRTQNGHLARNRVPLASLSGCRSYPRCRA